MPESWASSVFPQLLFILEIRRHAEEGSAPWVRHVRISMWFASGTDQGMVAARQGGCTKDEGGSVLRIDLWANEVLDALDDPARR